jgi:hypothetical protein
MEFVQNRFNVDINRVFAGDYLDAKGLYWALNGNIPLLNSVFPIDIEKVKSYLLENFKEEINNVFQSSNLNNNINKKRYVMEESYIVFKNKMVIKLAYNYCDILSNEQDHTFVESLTMKIKKFHRRERKKEFEINLISFDNNTFTLKEIEIKKTRLDLKLYYEDEFLEIDKTIQERLNKKNDKGIVLLHGLPGTGKTTYLRYLIGKVKKRILFVPPSVAANITNPEFMNLLLDYPNSILIIEDAENIIMDRQITGSSAVSNLLNISDGLLGDCLNTQIICTFNMPISKIDSALMRKGRLIAKYYFGKLPVAKAQYLSDKLKLENNITEPMTVAEIFNQNEQKFEDKRINVIGFRREEMMN